MTRTARSAWARAASLCGVSERRDRVSHCGRLEVLILVSDRHPLLTVDWRQTFLASTPGLESFPLGGVSGGCRIQARQDAGRAIAGRAKKGPQGWGSSPEVMLLLQREDRGD